MALLAVPDRARAEHDRYTTLRTRAVLRLHDLGMSDGDISDVLRIKPAQIRPLLGNRPVQDEIIMATEAVLDRYFRRVTDDQMTERLCAITYHTFERPAGPWYETSPVQSGSVLREFYVDGYVSADEYEYVMTHASFAYIPLAAQDISV